MDFKLKPRHSPVIVAVSGNGNTAAARATPVMATTPKPNTAKVFPSPAPALTTLKPTQKPKINLIEDSFTSVPSFLFPQPFLPNPDRFDHAPEIAHLRIERTQIKHYETEDEVEEPKTCIWKIIDWFDACVAWIKRFGRSMTEFEELDNLDPVAPRTIHSLEYIRKLADAPLHTGSGSGSGTHLGVGGSGSRKSMLLERRGSMNPVTLLKKQAYQSAHDGLSQLHQANYLYKQIILLLTFSRYAETPLEDFELELTHSRSVLGSSIWLSTFILQQMQFDCDVTTAGYPANEAQDVVRSIESIVAQSVIAWTAIVRTIEHVEQIHKKVQKIFTDLGSKIAHEKLDLGKDRHIRIHKKYERRAEELHKMKQFEGPRNHHKYVKVSQAPLRILFKDERLPPTTGNWRGFDMLPSEKKFQMVKMILKDTSAILIACTDQLQKIDVCLRGNAKGTEKATGKGAGNTSNSNSNSKMQAQAQAQMGNKGNQNYNYNQNQRQSKNQNLNQRQNQNLHPNQQYKQNQHHHPLDCFEEGVTNMNKYFEQIGEDKYKWTTEEVEEFKEAEKITMDNLDLLTLGTATLRALLHDARHIIHVCYETTRELDYIECRVMNSYEQVVYGCHQDMTNDCKPSLYSSRKESKKISIYDVEERGLDRGDAETHFERSIFQDILKEIPLLINNFSVAFTLQDAEGAFTESSHDLLSTQAHV